MSSSVLKSKTLKDDIADAPKVLFIRLFLSNFATLVSLRHKVDCADVSLLINSAFFDILPPKPQLVIILWLPKKYSKDRRQRIKYISYQTKNFFEKKYD